MRDAVSYRMQAASPSGCVAVALKFSFGLGFFLGGLGWPVTDLKAEPVAVAPAEALQPTEAKAAADPEAKPAGPKAPAALPPPEGGQKLSPDFDIWLSADRKAVLIDGVVTLREGMLEMFACLKQTKEHESVVALNTRAYLVHAALLRIGAKPGTPVAFDGAYHPPTGSKIEVSVRWMTPEGTWKQARAQDWVRDYRTKKPMSLDWVFAGSGFWRDETTGQQRYLAESGDLICVSNFSSATLDVPAESTQSNEGLMFAAFTERIPPLGAPVRLGLTVAKEEAGSVTPPPSSKP